MTDGDEYLDCGGARVSWRCTDCAKVSEGFAFPYGMCPHCGGKLEVLGERGSDVAGLEGIRTAFEIELGGQAFYRRAAAKASDATLKDLFLRLAGMEDEHMSTLAQRYNAEVPAPSPDFRMERAAIYAGIDGSLDDPASLFHLAIAFEERAAAHFSACADGAVDGSSERQLYRELAAEEREHADLLATELDRWKAGKAGIL